MEISRVVSDPKIMMGKPVVRGTRVTVEIILERLASGESSDQILEAYPFRSCPVATFRLRSFDGGGGRD